MSRSQTQGISKRTLVVGAALGAVAMAAANATFAPDLLSGSHTELRAYVGAPTAHASTPGDPNSTLSVADVAERTVDAVVSIAVTKSTPTRRSFRAPSQMQRGAGSGVIVSSSGLIVTNNHVVAGASELLVRLSDGRDSSAKVIGTDPKTDLAVLKLTEKLSGLKPLKFGDSDAMRLGEVVVAIGNPFGVGQTVTMGIVSAKGRAEMGIVDYEDFIQTDAAINPGNSGGALVNMKGELIGINTAILSRTGGSQGIGFSIPSNLAKPITSSLASSGSFARGWLGVSIRTLSRGVAEEVGVDVTRGVFVADVSTGSPAQTGGLVARDVIVAVDGVKTRTASKLRNAVALAGPNKAVSLEIIRKGKRRSLSVNLGKQQAGNFASPGRATPPTSR